MRTVFRGGSLVDGTGGPARRADVAITGSRVAEIGAVAAESDDRVVDVSGLVLAPGFIDPHTHYDAQILWDPSLSPSCWHGVTTAVMGNCGFGIAPTRPEHHGMLCRILENVEGMSVEALEAGIEWNFATFPEWLANLSALPKRLNVASLIGHTPLRLYVMGEDDLDRPATVDEAREMRRLVAEAMRAGAIGFATSMAPNHQGDRGRPVPSRGADWAEICEIASALKDTGTGIIQSTPGPGLFLEEFAALAELTGRPVTWTGILTRGGAAWPPWSSTKYTPMEMLNLQRDLSTAVWPQISCRDFAMELVLSDPLPFSSLPVFKELLALPRAQRPARCADPEWQARARPQMDEFWGHRWSKTSVLDPGGDLSHASPSMLQLGAEQGRHPFDVMLSIALEDDLRTRFKFIIANDDRDEVAELLGDHGTLVSLSDAGAHASQLSDACYSTHLLGHWVRDEQVLTLEDAVWRLTGQVADLFGLRDRGCVRVGSFADLVVFDPATIGPGRLERVHDLPAGADRLISHSTGIRGTWVNGVQIHGEDPDDDFDDHFPGVLVRS